MDDENSTPVIALNKLRATALAWLGRQEYSEAKFRRKLAQAEASDEQIELVVAEFIANNWLSEQRYCEAFVRSRIRKGQGWLRICNDGRVQGLDEKTLKQALNDSQTDWFELARETYQKRYAPSDKLEMKEKAKRLRFMQYRGFSAEQVSYAMAQSIDD